MTNNLRDEIARRQKAMARVAHPLAAVNESTLAALADAVAALEACEVAFEWGCDPDDNGISRSACGDERKKVLAALAQIAGRLGGGE